MEVTRESAMTRMILPMAGHLPIADFDNDGWKEIFVSREHVQSPLAEPNLVVAQPNTVFRNLGGVKFSALTAEAVPLNLSPIVAGQIHGRRRSGVRQSVSNWAGSGECYLIGGIPGL